MTSEWPWRYARLTHKAHIVVRFAIWLGIFEMQGVEKQKIGNAPNDLRMNLTLKRPKVLRIYQIFITDVQSLAPFSLYNQPLSRYMVVESRKRTEWHQNDLENVIVKSILCTLFTHEAQILANFQSRSSTSRQKLKIQNWNLTIPLKQFCSSMHEFLGVNLLLVYSFRGDLAWKFYSHVVPY